MAGSGGVGVGRRRIYQKQCSWRSASILLFPHLCPLPVLTLYFRLPVRDALPLLQTFDGSLSLADLRLVYALLEHQ